MIFMLCAQGSPLLRLVAKSPGPLLDAPDRGVALVGSDGSVLACSAVLAAASPWLRRSLITDHQGANDCADSDFGGRGGLQMSKI
jgi:hypothetical protein